MANAISALGGIAGGQAAALGDIDDILAGEIAKLATGHIPRPLRNEADRKRILALLVDQGFSEEEVLEAMKPYVGEEGVDYDTSDYHTYEFPPEPR